MMTVRIDGVAFDGFTSMSVIGSVDQLCHQFVMECSSDSRGAFPVKRGATAEFFIDDVLIMKGMVETIEGEYSADSYSVKISGRDSTLEVLKHDLPPDFVVRGPIQLKALMEKTLDAVGLYFEIVDEVGDLDDLSDKEVLTDDVGSTVWDFWVKLAEKRQVLITKDENARIIITRPNSNQYGIALVNWIEDPDGQNNILKASFKWDESDRRREYHVHSQMNVSVVRKDEDPPEEDEYWTPEWAGDQSIPEEPPLQHGSEIETLQQQLMMAEPGSEVETYLLEELTRLTGGAGTASSQKTKRVATTDYAIDNDVTSGISHSTAEDPCDNAECERLAKWKMNKDRVKSLSHSVTVVSNLINGDIWRPGYLILCWDEIADINSMMLISSVEYSVSVGEDGNAEETTQLTLTIPDGYSDDATASATQKQTSTIGGKFGALQ